MKWFLIIVLITVIMIIARAISEQYKEKYDFYYNLKDFLNQFKINLSFSQSKIKEFLDKINSKKQFKIFIDEYKNFLSYGKFDLSKIKILEADEKTELTKIINNIGKYNAKNEMLQVDAFMVSIDSKLEKAKQDKQKLCPLILKLSLLFAIALSILLI